MPPYGREEVLEIALRTGRGIAAQIQPELLLQQRLFVAAQKALDVLVKLEHIHAAADDDRVIAFERDAAVADIAHRHIAADGALEHIGDLLRRAVTRSEQDQRFHAVTSFSALTGGLSTYMYIRV